MGSCASARKPTVSNMSTELNPRAKKFKRAIRLYEVQEVESLTNLFNRNKCFNSGESPLTLAAREGHEAVVEVLLGRGADCNKLDHHGQGALHIATYLNDEETVDILLAAKANTNMFDGNKMTPLHIACDRGYSPMVKKLLEWGSNPTADNHGIAPLILAVLNGHSDCVEMLLKYGAEPNAIDAKGHTALRLAVTNNDPDSAEVLLKYGANPNLGSQSEDNLLCQAALEACPATIKTLVDVGLCPNTYREDDVPPLIAATAKGCAESVYHLITAGACVNTVDKRNQSSLTIAVLSVLDCAREAYYCKYFSNVYRIYSKHDPMIIVPENCVKCAMSLVQGGACLDPVWEKLSLVFPYSTNVSFEQMVLCEVLIQAYGFGKLTGNKLRKFIENLLYVKEYGLVKLLFSAGVEPCSEDVYVLSILPEDADREMFIWVKRLRSTPRQLRDLCRKQIRQLLSWNVLHLIEQLTLPHTLKQYVCIMDTEYYSRVDPGPKVVANGIHR